MRAGVRQGREAGVKALAGVPHGVSLAALASCIVLAACSSKLHQSQSWTTTAAQADPPSANERVVVLSESGYGDQFGTDCARTAVADRTAMPAEQFQEAFFPWFEPQNLPKNEADLGALLDREHLRDAITSAGVRYIVTISGETNSERAAPFIGAWRTFFSRHRLEKSLLDRVRGLASSPTTLRPYGLRVAQPCGER